jgi:signal transduction histidine kinase
MTNAAKHANASYLTIRVGLIEDELRIDVTDDGIGGAMSTGNGSGLVGLRDRVEALSGRLDVSSPPGKGTSLTAAIPVGSDEPDPAATG